MFDGRAATYDESAFHRALAAETVRFALADDAPDAQGTPEVHRVLDIATGTGLVLRALPSTVTRRCGVDVSAGMLAVARAELPEAELVQTDASGELPFPAGSFDLITCVTAFHLIAGPPEALRSWRGLLAPGGRVVVAVFRTDAADEVPEVAAALARGAERHAHGAHDHLHRRTGTPAALAGIAETAGFRLTRSETWMMPDPFQVCLVAELVPAD
ncbi:class I SAM-dependent methyltransferase [Planctomonas sp. JC2975]|nr:class I SAM-dependent methyltransferase [Planctomonas sp. JC2975]